MRDGKRPAAFLIATYCQGRLSRVFGVGDGRWNRVDISLRDQIVRETAADVLQSELVAPCPWRRGEAEIDERRGGHIPCGSDPVRKALLQGSTDSQSSPTECIDRST